MLYQKVSRISGRIAGHECCCFNLCALTTLYIQLPHALYSTAANLEAAWVLALQACQLYAHAETSLCIVSVYAGDTCLPQVAGIFGGRLVLAAAAIQQASCSPNHSHTVPHQFTNMISLQHCASTSRWNYKREKLRGSQKGVFLLCPPRASLRTCKILAE